MSEQRGAVAVGALPRPVASVTVAALLLCAAAAWLLTAWQAHSMGVGGVAMLSAWLFMVTWLVMMTAMMFPAVAPMVLAHARVVRSRGEGAMSTGAFVIGYLAIWTAAGLVPLAATNGLSSLLAGPAVGWLPRFGGAVLVAAGLYQLTPLKQACLRACRSPLGFILSHDFGGGSRAAVRAGISHGLFCLGCCWALMAVLVVMGLMNLAWMAVLAAVFFIEKNWRHGVSLSKVVGVACLLSGILVILRPGVLDQLRGLVG
jgi:predicted metal-binding membrane protein